MEKPAYAGGKPVRETKLYYGHQYLDEKDVQAVVDVLHSDYLTCGPKITELEQKLCELTGANMRWCAAMIPQLYISPAWQQEYRPGTR